MVRDRYPDMAQPTTFDKSRLRPDDIKLFGVLATEPEDLTGYLRTGGCVSCGACCTAFVLPIDASARKAEDFEDVVAGRLQVPVDPLIRGKTGVDDWERWLNLHDTTLVQLSETLVADLPVKCEPPGYEFAAAADDDHSDYYAWLEAQNVQVIQRDGPQIVVYVHRACDELANDGTCILKGRATRPAMCEDYPRHPGDIQGIDFCTYMFTPVNRIDMQRSAQAAVSTSSPKKKRPKKVKTKKPRKKHGRRTRK